MTDPNTIQLILQAGAVGLLLVFGVGAYLIIRRGMEIVNAFVSNHLSHLTSAIEKNTDMLDKLDETVNSLNRRM